MNDVSQTNAAGPELSRFEQRIKERREKHRAGIRDDQAKLDEDMRTLLEQREAFTNSCSKLVREVVAPRAAHMLQHLGQSEKTARQKITNSSWRCEIPHSAVLPVTIELSFSAIPCDDGAAALWQHDLTILPVLIDYSHHRERTFPLKPSPAEALAVWVEDALLDFIDAVQHVETNPSYYRDAMVVDPVCGMRLPPVRIAAKIDEQGKTVCFCSTVCRDAYVRSHHISTYRIIQ